eukprot:1533379-Alexandrium_andersonii.AAC.1
MFLTEMTRKQLASPGSRGQAVDLPRALFVAGSISAGGPRPHPRGQSRPRDRRRWQLEGFASGSPGRGLRPALAPGQT